YRQGRPAAGRGGRERRLSEGDVEGQGRAAQWPRRDPGGGAQRAGLIITFVVPSVAITAVPRCRASPTGDHCIAAILMPVGPRMTTNSTGRKNTIIGTVSLGGSDAAFFSASFMRMSRFSCAITRRLWPSGVP